MGLYVALIALVGTLMQLVLAAEQLSRTEEAAIDHDLALDARLRRIPRRQLAARRRARRRAARALRDDPELRTAVRRVRWQAASWSVLLLAAVCAVLAAWE